MQLQQPDSASMLKGENQYTPSKSMHAYLSVQLCGMVLTSRYQIMGWSTIGLSGFECTNMVNECVVVQVTKSELTFMNLHVEHFQPHFLFSMLFLKRYAWLVPSEVSGKRFLFYHTFRNCKAEFDWFFSPFWKSCGFVWNSPCAQCENKIPGGSHVGARENIGILLSRSSRKPNQCWCRADEEMDFCAQIPTELAMTGPITGLWVLNQVSFKPQKFSSLLRMLCNQIFMAIPEAASHVDWVPNVVQISRSVKIQWHCRIIPHHHCFIPSDYGSFLYAWFVLKGDVLIHYSKVLSVPFHTITGRWESVTWDKIINMYTNKQFLKFRQRAVIIGRVQGHCLDFLRGRPAYKSNQ